MTNKEVRLLLNIHDQKLQDLKKRGEIKAYKTEKKSTNGTFISEYDRDSVLEYRKKLDEWEKHRAETMLSAINDYDWEDKMLTEKDKLYGYSKEYKKWFPFDIISKVQCMGKTGRILVNGINKCGDSMLVQIYRRHFVKIKQLGWLNGWDHIWGEVEQIIWNYFNLTTKEERIKRRISFKIKNFQEMNYLGYLMPSQIYKPLDKRIFKN